MLKSFQTKNRSVLACTLNGTDRGTSFTVHILYYDHKNSDVIWGEGEVWTSEFDINPTVLLFQHKTVKTGTRPPSYYGATTSSSHVGTFWVYKQQQITNVSTKKKRSSDYFPTTHVNVTDWLTSFELKVN